MEKKRNSQSRTKTVQAGTRFLLENAPIQPALKFRIEEAYKSIRANIMFSVMKKGCKRIIVSSSMPNEGKTTTTVNLAVSISQADQRVLLIDGDLRKPKIHHYFSVPNSPGLTNYLSNIISGRGNMDLFGVIRPTEYKNLCILSSGSIPPNPAELLGSEIMSEFLDEVSKDFDYIIIDTPPVNVVSDALPLIRESDGVVLVVRSNQSSHPELQKALSALEFIDAKILGFVVNHVETKSNRMYTNGTYGGYKYGYSAYGGYSYKSSRGSRYKNNTPYDPRS